MLLKLLQNFWKGAGSKWKLGWWIMMPHNMYHSRSLSHLNFITFEKCLWVHDTKVCIDSTSLAVWKWLWKFIEIHSKAAHNWCLCSVATALWILDEFKILLWLHFVLLKQSFYFSFFSEGTSEICNCCLWAAHWIGNYECFGLSMEI